jgi:hypothetical protein
VSYRALEQAAASAAVVEDFSHCFRSVARAPAVDCASFAALAAAI